MSQNRNQVYPFRSRQPALAHAFRTTHRENSVKALTGIKVLQAKLPFRLQKVTTYIWKSEPVRAVRFLLRTLSMITLAVTTGITGGMRYL